MPNGKGRRMSGSRNFATNAQIYRNIIDFTFLH